jgi:large subunit ribosomal protein L17
MLKRIFGKKLSRNTGSRKALFRSQIVALVEKGSIVTTKAKAKAIQGDVDKIMTMVRKESIAGRRKILAKLGNDRETVDLLFKNYLGFTKKRPSGFTRIINLGPRKGDMAEMARIEWVDKLEVKKVKKEEDGKNISSKK